MDPVDAEVGEKDEGWELDPVPRGAEEAEEWVSHLGCVVVYEAVAADFGYEARYCEYGHNGNGVHRLRDFHAHLVLEVFRVVERLLVEDEDVR